MWSCECILRIFSGNFSERFLRITWFSREAPFSFAYLQKTSLNMIKYFSLFLNFSTSVWMLSNNIFWKILKISGIDKFSRGSPLRLRKISPKILKHDKLLPFCSLNFTLIFQKIHKFSRSTSKKGFRFHLIDFP